MARILPVIVLAAAAIAATPAKPHDAKGPNGGLLVHAGNYHFELIGKENSVEVFLTDQQDKPVSTQAFKGVAVIMLQGKSQRVPLEAAGGNKMTGSATAAVPVVPRGVIQITTPNGKTIQANSK